MVCDSNVYCVLWCVRVKKSVRMFYERVREMCSNVFCLCTKWKLCIIAIVSICYVVYSEE